MAINHYNKNYVPIIEEEDFKNLRKLYKETCGSSKVRDLNFYCKDNLSKIYINNSKRFLIFKEKDDIAVWRKMIL